MLVRVGHLSGEVKQYEMVDGSNIAQLMELFGDMGIDFELVCGGEIACPSDLLSNFYF